MPKFKLFLCGVCGRPRTTDDGCEESANGDLSQNSQAGDQPQDIQETDSLHRSASSLAQPSDYVSPSSPNKDLNSGNNISTNDMKFMVFRSRGLLLESQPLAAHIVY